MQKRDWIVALRGLVGIEAESINRVVKKDLVAVYKACYGSSPPDGVTIGDLRVAIADEIHYEHDYTEGGDGLRVETLQYAVIAIAVTHIADQEAVTADNIEMPAQNSTAQNEYLSESADGQGQQYTREALIDYLTEIAEEHGEPVTTTTIKSTEGPSVATISNEFGGIPAARDAAGLDVDPVAGAPRTHSNEVIRIYIRNLALRLGRPPTKKDIREDSGISFSTIVDRFDTVDEARESVGVGHPDDGEPEAPLNPGSYVYAREPLIEHLQYLAEELGRPPTGHDITQMDGPSKGPFTRVFGGIPAAREAADVGHPTNNPSGGASSESKSETQSSESSEKGYDRDVLLGHLKVLAEELEKSPTIEDVNEAKGPSATVYSTVFGGIIDAR